MIDDDECGTMGGIKIGRGNRSICPSATLTTTNPTWPDMGLNTGRRDGKPVTNRLSYDTTNIQLRSDSRLFCKIWLHGYDPLCFRRTDIACRSGCWSSAGNIWECRKKYSCPMGTAAAPISLSADAPVQATPPSPHPFWEFGADVLRKNARINTSEKLLLPLFNSCHFIACRPTGPHTGGT
jgi:hypothetical protein